MSFKKLLIISIGLTTCSWQGYKTPVSKAEFTEKQITLSGFDKDFNDSDTLGQVSISIPNRLDTFYKWYHTKKCRCGYIKYRFTDKRYPLSGESEAYYTIGADSVFQLTIWHKPLAEITNSIGLKDPSIDDSYLLYGIPDFVLDKPTETLRKEYKNVNGKYYHIAHFKQEFGYISQKATQYIVAITNLRDRQIWFVAECSGKDTAGFTSVMYKAIESIRISEKLK